MFDLRELKLMFLDPTDLIINNINKYLSSNKAIKFILRGLHIVNCTAKLFSYQAKNVKNGKNNLKSWRIHLNIYFLLVE